MQTLEEFSNMRLDTQNAKNQYMKFIQPLQLKYGNDNYNWKNFIQTLDALIEQKPMDKGKKSSEQSEIDVVQIQTEEKKENNEKKVKKKYLPLDYSTIHELLINSLIAIPFNIIKGFILRNACSIQLLIDIIIKINFQIEEIFRINYKMTVDEIFNVLNSTLSEQDGRNIWYGRIEEAFEIFNEVEIPLFSNNLVSQEFFDRHNDLQIEERKQNNMKEQRKRQDLKKLKPRKMTSEKSSSSGDSHQRASPHSDKIVKHGALFNPTFIEEIKNADNVSPKNISGMKIDSIKQISPMKEKKGTKTFQRGHFQFRT
eukprot:403357931